MKKVFISIIRFYQRHISGLKRPCCKYYPTCSEYAVEAIERFGAVKGLILAAWRILRCNPWSNGGVDKVPEKFRLYTLKGEKRRRETKDRDQKTDIGY